MPSPGVLSGARYAQIPDGGAPRGLGRDVPGQPRARGQAYGRQDAHGQHVAATGAHRGGARCGAHQAGGPHRPGGPVTAAGCPAREAASRRRRRAPDPDPGLRLVTARGGLLRAGTRRPGRAPPRPSPAPRGEPTAPARLRGHPHTQGGRRLTVYFQPSTDYPDRCGTPAAPCQSVRCNRPAWLARVYSKSDTITMRHRPRVPRLSRTLITVRVTARSSRSTLPTGTASAHCPETVIDFE